MEKTTNKKHNYLITGGLAALCIITLIVTYFLLKKPEDTFEPVEAKTETVTETWTDNTESEVSSSVFTTPDGAQVTGSETDNTQIIVYEDETTVVTSLSGETKPSADTEKPTEKPTTTDDITDPDNPPVYESVASDAESSAPTASTEHSGQVYDPVFGWITTGGTSQDTVDSSGDINKQIGEM